MIRPSTGCIGKNIDEVAAALKSILKRVVCVVREKNADPAPEKSEYMLIHRGFVTGLQLPISLESTFSNGAHIVDCWVLILTIN